MRRIKGAVGYCQRSGDKVPLKTLVRDGYRKNLMVTPEMRDIAPEQERPVRLVEQVALLNPAPQNDIDVPPETPGPFAAVLFPGERYFGGGT
jgi:hypothetical protein